MSTSRIATDPRDYVYALLGPVHGTISRYFEPGYSQSASCVYQKAMLTIMADAGNLDFLLLKVLQNIRADPSWCVDFSRTGGLQQARSILRDLVPLVRWSTEELRFLEHQDAAVSFEHDSHHVTITLAGTEIDVVSIALELDVDKEFFESWEHLPLYHLSRGCKRSGSMTKFAKTYKTIDENIPPKIRVSASEAWGTVGTLYRRFAQYVRAPRSIFATQTGRIGFLTNVLRSGDVICQLKGAVLPMALRPTQQHMFLVVDVVQTSGSESLIEAVNAIFAEQNSRFIECSSEARPSVDERHFVLC